MSTEEVKPGTLFERDGKRREVVRLIPADRFTSSAVEWRRPGQEFRSSACSVHAWLSGSKRPVKSRRKPDVDPHSSCACRSGVS